MATKYKCPYCDKSGLTKEDLGGHIDEEHRDLIPEGWSANRLAFKIIYKKDHGTCVVCKKETQWNEKRCKYQRLCGDPKCKHYLREAALKNHIKVYKCKTLLGDPHHQEEMLRHRKISGEYTFTDGGKIGYVGSYEKKFLEFMDKTLECKSDEIIEPGPTFEYDMDGKKHFWITDFLYVPYNLVIEVKDGGDNPNKKRMPLYRKKEACKDKLMTENGTYNYLKLTNNNFAQLLEIFAALRMQMINDEPENRRVIIRVNENTDLLNEAVDPKYTRKYKNFDEFCKYIKNLDELLHWIKYNKIKWPSMKDREHNYRLNKIAWPDIIINEKIGDCLDQAVLMYYFCKKKNIPARLGRSAGFLLWKGRDKYRVANHIMCFAETDYGVVYLSYDNFDDVYEVRYFNGTLTGPFKSYDEAKNEWIRGREERLNNASLKKKLMLKDVKIKFKFFTDRCYEYLDKF